MGRLRISSAPSAALRLSLTYDPVCRFLLQVNSGQSANVPDDDAAEGTSSHVQDRAGAGEDERSNVGPSRKKRSKAEKKAQRGANKGRRFGKIRDEVEVCWKVAVGQICEFGDE